jgi:adenylosuccinate synthase
MKNKKIDILVDLQFGDSGKGKISKWLLNQHPYDAICKYNGGPNAGHAVWIGDTKYTAHMLTSGIYDENCKIIIGPGCVLDVDKFLNEINQFSSFNVEDRILVHPHVHIIQSKHIEIDGRDLVIGTTKQGMGPCYADKMSRTGLRAEYSFKLQKYIENYKNHFSSLKYLLMEGSQGWWLDIDNGNYPYVTSSNVHPAHAFSTFGLPLSFLDTIYGVGKVYETYSGFSEDLMFCAPEDEEKIRQEGSEYGETTGRARKIGYLNLDRLIKASNQTGTNVIILNKMDILEKLQIFKLIYKDKLIVFEKSEEFLSFIKLKLLKHCENAEYVIISGNRETI